MLQQQNRLGQAAGAPLNCISEAAGLGESPRALVCTGEEQLLGLSAAAAHLQVPPYGAVSRLTLPPVAWAALGCAGSEQWSKGRVRAVVLWLD